MEKLPHRLPIPVPAGGKTELSTEKTQNLPCFRCLKYGKRLYHPYKRDLEHWFELLKHHRN